MIPCLLSITQFMEEQPFLLDSLLSTTRTTTITITPGGANYARKDGENNVSFLFSNSGLIFRLILISFVGLTAIWAKNQASKGFMVTIVNEAGESTAAGKCFSLFYQSDDNAIRILLKASNFIESNLYGDPHDDHDRYFHFYKKQVNHVILRLASQILSETVLVESFGNGKVVITLSPQVVRYNEPHLIVSAIQRGMARVWLWDGNGTAPPQLISGMAEYLVNLMPEYKGSGGSYKTPPDSDDRKACWEMESPGAVAEFLRFCDGQKPGVIRRLNRRLRDGWDERTVDDALDMPANHACASFKLEASLDQFSY